ncbi:hypothetical protein GCM10010483_22610 [Actinokineospora diospyrosa]
MRTRRERGTGEVAVESVGAGTDARWDTPRSPASHDHHLAFPRGRKFLEGNPRAQGDHDDGIAGGS